MAHLREPPPCGLARRTCRCSAIARALEKALAEAEARRNADEEERERREQGEEKARRQADEERQRSEAEAKRQKEEERRRVEEEEAKRKAEGEERRRAEKEERQRRRQEEANSGDGSEKADWVNEGWSGYARLNNPGHVEDAAASSHPPPVEREKIAVFPRQSGYQHSMLHGISPVFVVIYIGILIVGLFRLAQGPEAWSGWLAVVTSPIGIIFHVLAFVFALIHLRWWFKAEDYSNRSL